MIYSMIVKKRIGESFDQVNNHDWDTLMTSIAPNVHHRFLGAHAIGGERHDRDTLRRWFERLGRVLPSLQSADQRHLGQRLAVEHHCVRAVGRQRHPAQRRTIRPTRHPRDHPAVGQDPRARCLRGFTSRRVRAQRPSRRGSGRSCRPADRQLTMGGRVPGSGDRRLSRRARTALVIRTACRSGLWSRPAQTPAPRRSCPWSASGGGPSRCGQSGPRSVRRATPAVKSGRRRSTRPPRNPSAIHISSSHRA